MVKSYCVKQKKQTECVEPSGYKQAKNGRLMFFCTCAECGITKTKFIKSGMTGGDLMMRITSQTKIPEDGKVMLNEIYKSLKTPHETNKPKKKPIQYKKNHPKTKDTDENISNMLAFNKLNQGN